MKIFARGCYVKNRVSLFQFEELLNEWLKMNVEYMDTVKGDAAFAYTEMTNVAMLSAAAWRLKWVSVCEYQGDKGSPYASNRVNKNKWYGRTDLFMRNDHPNGSYVAEAKQEELSLLAKLDDDDWGERLSGTMAWAALDAHTTAKAGDGGHPLGL